ncbi:uncharacterized protein LOC141756873 isoform X2 [Sebastes fasciatus]|uniref:uncharacterized protein LOC141756873 isoform X2 n=1 Tax=Sebastes fasciatus TaxID=394691 RepID=UPI003D9E5691
MFRRSRFSIRPNVGTTGRTAGTPQEASSASQEASETPKDVSESSTATAVTDDKSVVTPSEKPTAPGDGNDQNVEGTSSSAAVQRRKRFSIKPKVAPGRPSTLARTPKSPVKAVSQTPIEVPVSDLDKPSTATPPRLQSPRRRRSSEESKQPKMPPKPTLIPSDSSEPSAVPTTEDSLKQSCVGFSSTNLQADSGKELESTSGSQVEEVPSRPPDKVPLSLPDKEAIALSEKAKTLVSSKSGVSLSPPAFSLSRLLNDPSDLQRLAKARKLRELLKQEMHKEKKIKKANSRAKEYTLDPAKMTMRDLIRYLPVSNPMTSSLEDSAQENETVVPPSPVREPSPERAKEPEVLPKIASPREEDEGEAAEAAAEADEDQDDDDVMVPQVKVAEDGSLIIDEESLTVEVLRAKGPNPAQGRDPIFERGSTTTYSSFRKGTYSKPWSNEETDMFFLAISMVGTDFSMICQLFPHRARSEIKNKFKKEERANSWRIDKAFRERRKLDIEYFSKLLEKILEVQKNRKKLKSLAGKKSPKKKKPKDKKSARKLSVVEEEDEEEQNEMPDLEEEGEKENEDLCNEGGTTVAKPKKKRKRKDASTEEPNDKKNKTGEKSSEQDEAYIPGDTEAALPEDRPTSDMSEKTDSVNEAKDATIKPAKLSRGRAPKPLLPLGRKWGKKAPPPSTKTSDAASDNGDESVIDGASKEQEVNKDASPLREANKRKSANDDSEEEDATVPPPRPTRYGRVPKPTKLLNYPAKEAASETTPASPEGSTASAARPKPKCTAKRGRSSKQQSAQESKKPKLVTLRASQSEDSDEEDEQQREQEEEVEEEQHAAWSSSKDSAAPVFVPASLRSPRPVISEVEETMEELDILANMPDVLGISQDALCPDASFDLVHNETGSAEACEHQLDLLVDVIDFLSSDHTEVTEDESYNEAAQTLLTIGNLAHLSQSAQNEIAIQDHITGTTSVSVNETSQHLEEEIASTSAAQEENSATPLMSATSVYGVTETSETDTAVELQNSTTDNDDIPVIESSDQRTGSDMVPTPQLHSSPESSKINSPQTKRGRLSKVKPKPNLGQASRTTQSKSQPETSTVRTAEESHTVAPDLCQVTETLSAAEETPKIAACSRTLLKDEMSCIEVKPAEEPSGSQKRSVGQLKSGTATSNQSALENQNLSEAEQATSDSRSASESTDKLLMSHVGTIKSSCNSQVTSGTAVTEAQIGRGSNIDSAPVQESSDHPAPCVTPVEELPVSQEDESEVGSARQTRTSRFQKVKPRVIIAKTSRTARSKPQTTKDTVEKDSNPTPHPKFHEKTIVEIEAEPTCTTSPEKLSQNPGPASDLTPLLDLGSTPTPTEELSTTGEKKTDVGVVGQAESGASTSHQSASETQNLSEAQFEPSREQATRDTTPTFGSTDEVLMSPTTESSCNNPLTPDLPVTESQVGQGSNIDSVPVQKSSDHPVTPVEELPISHKEESEVGSTCQTRKSRFQKVKPKVNLPQTLRTARSKPQTTKDTIEKDSNPTPNPKFHEKTIAEVEAEPTCTTSLEKPSQSLAPASDLTPLLDLGSTPTPTEELSTTGEKKTDVGVVGQAESGASTSHQSASETQNLSEAQFEPSREQATRDTMPTFGSTDEVLMSPTTESSCNNPLTPDLPVTESQVGQGSNIDSVPVQKSSDHPVTPVEELPISHKEESEVGSTCQTRKSRFQKVKPKVNLPQTLRTARSKPQTTKDTIEKDSNPTPNPKFHEKTIAEVEAEPTCTTSLEKPSQSLAPASDLIPSLDLGSTLTPTEELSTTEEKKTDVGVVGQAESGAATSDQRASETQNVSEAQFEPDTKEATRDTTPTLESTDEKLVGTTESRCSNPQTSDSAVTESQVGQRSNINSAPVQESSDHPAPPVEELPVSLKEESEVGSTPQTRKSRFQKVKPKVNLAQTSRTARSKPQTTRDTVEKDSDPTPHPKFHDKKIEGVEAEPTCTTSPEKQSQSRGPASDLIPSLDLGSILTPTEELSTTEETKTNVGVVGQAESGASTSQQSASENQNLSEAQFDPSRQQSTRDTKPTFESTNEVLMFHVGTTESSCIDLPTSESAVTESQIGQGSNIVSSPISESNDHPAQCVGPVEELPVSQKEESEVGSTRQTRTSRFQRVKPKVNLVQSSRTAHSKPQTTKETAEKDCNPTPNPKVHEKTIAEVEAEPACTTSPEKTNQNPGPASDLILSLDLGSTLTPTEELSTTEEKKTDVGVGQAESGAATSDQSASETQNLSEAQFEPSREQATRDTTPASVSTHEVLMSHVGTTESRQVTSDPEVTESQVGQGSPEDSAPVQESSDHSAPPVEELPVSLKEESEVKPTRQTTRGRLLIVKPKPNLSQTSRTVRSKPQTTEDPVTPMQLADTPSSPTSRLESTDKMITEVEAQPTCSSTPPETPSQITSTGTASVPEDLSSMEEQKTDVGCGQGSKSEGPEQNVSQRRRRFSNVKPNLGSSPRTTRTKLQSNDISKPSEQSNMDTSLTSEQQPADNNNAQTERVLADSKHLTSTHCSLHTELLSSTKSLDSTNDKGTSSDGVVIATSWIAETQSVLTESVLENKSSEKPTVEGESKEDRTSNTDTVESGPASQLDCKQDMSIGVTETKTAVSDLQKSSQDGSTESKIESTLPTNTQSAPDPKESIHQPRSENDSEAQNQEALQQCSETNQTATQSTDQSEPTDSPSRKAPQTRRGRLIKPQPRLGLSRRPPQPQQVQNAKQADADCGTHSEGLDASVCHKLVSEHQPDIKEPIEGAVGPLFSNQNSSPNVAGSSLGCVTQVADNDTQDASTSSTGATQSLPSFTIFPDTLSQQEPSDPEEPFFILSLTEIPVGPSGEVAGSVPEPLPYLPVTDASIAQQSIPGESSAAAGDGPLSDVAVPVSVEESDVTGLINVKDIGPDPVVSKGWNKENPVDPHESSAVHPSKLPETVEKNDETEIPPTKQRGTRRREAQVKPNITKRKQASKTLAAKEAESITIQTDTTQPPELPGPSVQSKACDDVVTEPQTGSGDHIDVEKETRAVREDPEGSSSGAQTTRTRATSIQQRRAKDFLPFISETNNAAPASDSPPGKAASKGRKVRAPRAAGKRSAPAPVASTSRDDAPTRSATQPTEETHSASSTTSSTQTEQSRLRSVTTPSTSPCPAEVSASQPCVESSSIEEEPTNVSQYFLSDIFTEVDEA